MGCQITDCGRTGNEGHGCRVNQRLLLVCPCDAVWFGCLLKDAAKVPLKMTVDLEKICMT